MVKFFLPFVLGCLLLTIACQTAPTATTVPVKNNIEKEQHRPHFHFTPKAKWMNDPNGMVYHEGEYHLFYQYYPDSTVWGPMHWGHAISTDLVNWEHLPVALYPDSLGYIFSGSAVIDWKNTSGFGKNGQPPMIAIFTYHDPVGAKAETNTFQYQGIAYSNDKGRTWTKYAGNPVIPNPGIRDFRDPKVIWDEANNQWLMVFAAWNQVKFYGSPDLKNWQHLSDFGKEWGTHAGVWECPDIFPMNIEGTTETKWVLLQSLNPGSSNGGSGTQYFIGDWDGKNFRIEEEFAKNLSTKANENIATQEKTKPVWLDYGRDNYAGVTWSDIPKADGRRIFIGWMSNWDYALIVPTKTWRSATTLPRTLTLKRTQEGLRLFTQPVRELTKLRKKSQPIVAQKGEALKLDLSPVSKQSILAEVNLKVVIPKGAKSKLTLELANSQNEKYLVGYDAAQKAYFSDRRQSGKVDFSKNFAQKIHLAPRYATSDTVQLQVFFDVASAELFADDGKTVMTDIFFPNEDFNRLRLLVDGDDMDLLEGMIYWLE